MAIREMPTPLDIGQHMAATIGHPIHHWRKGIADTQGRRQVMGYPLPEWQRPLVWTKGQMVRFLESVWLGLPVGTWAYVQNNDPATDGLLIDGQQRLWAIQQYLEDGFPVFGVKWSKTTDVDKRGFEMSRHFHCYLVKSADDEFLRSYYNLMNFSGTAHKRSQRA